MIGKPNPFRYLKPVPPQEFIGRWSMVREIALDLTLDEGDSHAIIGGRRFGKSSLLFALHHDLRQLGADARGHLALPVLIDFKRSFASETAFFAHAFYEICRQVDATNTRGRSNDPSPISKVALNQTWLNNLMADPLSLSLTRFEEAVSHLLDLLYEVNGPTRIVLLLDEVDNVLTNSWHHILFSQLRSLIYSSQLADSIRLVLAGSRRFLDEVTDWGSPLWNVLKLNYLAAFDQSATFELIARAQTLPESVQQAVWYQSGGHPFLAQYLLHYLWNKGEAEVNEATVTQTANRFIHERQPDLEGWLHGIEDTGLQLFQCFVNRSDWLDELELIRVVDGDVKRGLVALSYHGLIVHDGNWSFYRRTGDLFYQWVLSKYQNEQKKEYTIMALPPEVAVNAASFLFEIGHWAASELKERWILTRQGKKTEQSDEIELSEVKGQIRQKVETLLLDLTTEHSSGEVERVLLLIERKRDLIAEWHEIKVDNEEEYNRQKIDRAALRLRQKELNEKISNALFEIEVNLQELGVQVKKEAVE